MNKRDPLKLCYFKRRGTPLLKECLNCTGILEYEYYYLQNMFSLNS